jgi:hypothetical protein
VRKRFLRLLAIIASMALVVACGSSGDGGGDSTVPGSPDTTQAAPGDVGGDGGEDDGDDGTGIPSGVCLEATEAMSAAMASVGTGFGGDPGTFDEIGAQLDAMASSAPDEVQDDFEALAEELGAFYDALADIGITPGATPTAEQLQALEEATNSVDQAVIDEASDNIEAWFDANC